MWRRQEKIVAKKLAARGRRHSSAGHPIAGSFLSKQTKNKATSGVWNPFWVPNPARFYGPILHRAFEGTSELKITHETIANHLGTHREVITRMLRYFQDGGMVRLSRGTVVSLSEEKLRQLQG